MASHFTIGSESVVVEIDEIVSADSLRLTGESSEHIGVLAQVDEVLPPIVVHRPTMRVIDGMHRLQAARSRGRHSIEVRFFTGSEQEAFILAIELNSKHGLPLSLEDRKFAAVRIVKSHPQWSDRKISSVVGLAPSTVGGIRRRSTDRDEQSNTRIGRDGRSRPLSAAVGRMSASNLINENPNAAIREIAATAGIATSTAQNVRKRLLNGKDPVPPRQRDDRAAEASSSEMLKPAMDYLKMDPSLRFTDAGRALLRLLEAQTTIVRNPVRLATAVPPHSVSTVATLAREIGDAWKAFADRLQPPGDGRG